MESYTIKNLTFSYPTQEKRVLDQLSFTTKQGEFLVLCGPSGSGKTTLLRQLKPLLAPYGARSGEIFLEGTPVEELDQREQSKKIGFVLQSPENQIVTDKVWHELAFGLESLGVDPKTIRLRVAEIASFFGIQNWFYKNVSELSGGQKQLLNLGAVMVMQPSVLILDEPTSQLDPIAAADFLAAVRKINRELGVTVIMTEHRLEEVLPICDRVLVLDKGKLICDGTPEEAGKQLKSLGHQMFLSMPVPMRIYAGVENDLPCPVTERDGREWLNTFAKTHTLKKIPAAEIPAAEKSTPSVELKDVCFRYDREAPDVVKGLSVKIYPGEFYAILGGNGTGKTTTLSILSGVNTPYRGTVKINGRLQSEFDRGQLFHEMLGVLPQNPKALFVRSTVWDDLEEMFGKLSKEEKESRIQAVASLCRLNELLWRHPYDLSGGEQQRAALAKVLLLRPKILILDEPTKGMDSAFKQVFANILRDLLKQGVTVIMASHDIEFCAQYAHRCALFFDGNIVSSDVPRRFFPGNSFYTTAANRISRHKLPDAVTAEDVIAACGGDPPDQENPEKNLPEYSGQEKQTLAERKKVPKKRSLKLPVWRIAAAAIAVLAFFITGAFVCSNLSGIAELITAGDLVSGGMHPQSSWRYALMILALTAELAVFFLSLHKKGGKVKCERAPARPQQLSKRTLLAMLVILAAIPLTIYIGFSYLGDRKYYFISMLIILEIMLPFVMVFEGRRPQARELIVIAVLSAIGVAGRAAFFMLPQFKPVIAVVILAGVAFGGESGFLVGAVTGFVSNMFFGQGPWTPWQMFAFGFIGFLAGVLFHKGILKRNTIALCIFGGLAAFLIYGGIMNPAAVLMFQSHPAKQMFYLAYLQGIPFDLIHASATVIFLSLLAKPMLEKLDRIKVKYGLLESSQE